MFGCALCVCYLESVVVVKVLDVATVAFKRIVRSEKMLLVFLTKKLDRDGCLSSNKPLRFASKPISDESLPNRNELCVTGAFL